MVVVAVLLAQLLAVAVRWGLRSSMAATAVVTLIITLKTLNMQVLSWKLITIIEFVVSKLIMCYLQEKVYS